MKGGFWCASKDKRILGVCLFCSCVSRIGNQFAFLLFMSSAHEVIGAAVYVCVCGCGRPPLYVVMGVEVAGAQTCTCYVSASNIKPQISRSDMRFASNGKDCKANLLTHGRTIR